MYILYIILILIFVLLNYNFKFLNENFKNKKIKESVVIVGCAKKIEKNLPTSLKKIDMLINLFEKSNVIIFENDSTDNTLNILTKWKDDRNNIEIISESKETNPILRKDRTYRLAYGRNLLLDKARLLNPYYFINMDLDNVVSKLNESNFLKIFNVKEEWSMLGSNNIGKYRDLWALRCKGWLEGDYHQGYKFYKGNRSIDKKEPLIEVDSCFNGFAIYKMKYLKDCRYHGYYNESCKIKNERYKRQKCEHVDLHLEMKEKNNAKIYIAPFLISF